MTVCVGIKVNDGIVFAADSAISLSRPTENGGYAVSNVWMHGQKVFNLHRELPVMAMTAGTGNFGTRSINSLAKEFRIQLMRILDVKSYQINDIVNMATQYFQDAYARIDPQPTTDFFFEFWIGGYGHDNVQGEIWKIAIRGGQSPETMLLAEAEASGEFMCGGGIQAINRLLLGYDPQVISILQSHLEESQVRLITSELSNLNTPLAEPTMPVQDAIDLADYFVDMSKRYVAFLPGADVVGGDTDIATTTRFEGFKWVRRKHYYPSHLNRRTDHVR